MDLQPAQTPMPLPRVRSEWPGPTPASRDAARDAKVARQFETLIARTLLQTARAAKLGDDGLGASGDSVRDMVDNARAEAIARAAPLGVARLLQGTPR